MNLIDMLNEVLSQSTFLKRQSFANSSDPDDIQMVSIANRVAYEIKHMYNWMELRNTFTLNLATGVDEYDLPDDFDGYVPNSGWEADGSRPIDLPVPDGRWYQYKFSTLSAAGILRCRIYGDKIVVDEDHDTTPVEMEYVSKWVIRSNTDQPKEYFTNDSDTFILDDQLFILGVQGHWAQAKGLPQYAEWMANYQRKTNEAIGRTVGAQRIGGIDLGRKRYGRRSPYYPLWR